MDNPAGYLFTMAKRDVLRTFRAPVLRRPPPACSQISSRHLPALAELSEMQRQVVYLVDGFGWGLTDTDRILGMSISTVRNHWSRGLARLRASLKSETDV